MTRQIGQVTDFARNCKATHEWLKYGNFPIVVTKVYSQHCSEYYFSTKDMKAFFCIFFLYFGYNMTKPLPALSQGYSVDTYINIDEYKRRVIASDFSTKFGKDTVRPNYKSLRAYLDSKRRLLDALIPISRNINSRFYTSTDTSNILDDINRAKSIQADLQPGSDGFIEESEYGRIDDLLFKYTAEYQEVDSDPETSTPVEDKKYKKSDVTRLLDEATKYLNNSKKKSKEISILRMNIENINQDVYKCENTLDEYLRPELKLQDFKTNTSIIFAVLVGFIIMAFLAIIFFKADDPIAITLLSDNGLQFITLFVLIIAIIAFGILGILEARELAAILSGISGYILGRGLNLRNTNVSPNIPFIPTPGLTPSPTPGPTPSLVSINPPRPAQ